MPARFTTADAFVAIMAFWVADACTEPDTFMNTALLPALIAAAAPVAITEPVTMTGDVVIIPFVAEPDTLPVTNVGAVVLIAAAVAEPATFPVTVVEVPVKFIA